MKNILGTKWGIILAGLLIGIIASLLQYAGNPANMGICVACFERDIAGALGLHRAEPVQYLRPEIIGLVLGAFIISVITKEFKPRSGSSPVIRFILGMSAMFGALMFLGCPWRAMLRLAGGDWNALSGIAGLATGIAGGAFFIKNGFSLGRAYPEIKSGGWVFPAFMAGLFIMLVLNTAVTDKGPLFASVKGPGSQHANLWFSIAGGLVIGMIAQRSRFCTMGAIRDVIIVRDFHLVTGLVSFIAAAFIINLMLGQFKPGFEGQPIAHTDGLWNFMGMLVSGLAFALAGGCPGRQLILAGEGNADSGIFVFGMITGAAFAHNFNLASGPAGVTEYGPYAVAGGLVFCLVIALIMREKVINGGKL